MTMQLRSSALQPESPIERKYTCEGDDVAPPLEWSDAPANTRTFALIVDDPDAPGGDWSHWVVWNLPADTTRLPEGGQLPQGAESGQNDFRKSGYGGPCPPPGKPHRYFFRLYALDDVLDLPNDAKKPDVERAMQGHILDQAEMYGTFGR